MTETSSSRSTEDHHQFFSSNPAPMLIYERGSLRIVAVNDAFRHVHGYSQDEALGMTLPDLHPENEKDALIEFAARVQDPADDTHWHNVRKDGSVMDVLVRSHDIRHGGRDCRMAVITDITRFKRAEAELTRSASMLKQIFTTANVGIALLNPQGALVIANDYAMRLFRITTEELSRTRYLDYVRPEERDDAARTMADLLTQKITVIDIERRYRRPDGSEFWGHLVAEHCLDADKRLLGVLGVLTDVTEQRRAVQALGHERTLLRTLLHNLPDLVWSQNPDGVYQMCNPAFERLLGCPESELIGKTVFDFAPSEHAEIHAAQERTIRETGRSARIEKWLTLAADGSRRLFDIFKNPMRDDEGRIVGIVGVARDITEQRAAENALHERMKERQCLYEIFAQTEDLTQPLDVQFRRVAALIRQGWQWPELAAACLEWQGQRYSTPHFTPTPWMMSVQGWTDQAQAVDLHIAYESRPATDGAIFPAEERTLADTIVHRLADVINRRHAARLAAEREQLIAIMFAQTTDAIILTDPQTRSFVDFNTAAHEGLGYTREEFARLRVDDIEVDHSPDQIHDNAMTALTTPLAFTTRHRHKNGDILEVNITLQPVTLSGRDLISAVWRDVTEQKIREREREHRASRLQLHTRLLGWLSTSEAGMDGDISRLAFELTEVLGATLGIPRVSVWIMDENETRLTCLNLYETSSQSHSDGQVIHEDSFRNEMQALRSSRYVSTSAPCTDTRTAGYAQSYLLPNDITAMLDCVVVCGGRNRGVVCFEYVSQPHQWQPDEISFGCQVADQLGMAMLNKDRLDAAQVLHWDARVRQTLERLYRSIMHDAPSLAAISNSVLAEAKKLTECPDGYVGAIDKDGALVLHAHTDLASREAPPKQRRLVFPQDRHDRHSAPWGCDLDIRQPFLTNVAPSPPVGESSPVEPQEIHSLLSVPVLLGNTLAGQISLANKPGGFSRRDQDALTQLADFYAMAIQHVRAEEALVNSKLLLENILHGISAGIIIVDPATLRIEDVNDVVLDMVQARPEDLIGQPCSILNWEDKNGEAARQCMAHDRPIVHQEFRVRHLDGKAIPVSKTVIEARIGDAAKFVEILFDISAQKDMERQLALAQKMESIGQLAAGIAHEINTPAQYLTDNLRFVSEGFTSFANLLLMAKARGKTVDCAALWAEHDVDFLLEEIPQALDQSLEGVGRISTIVQAMKRFSHPGSEQREQINVNEALRTTTLVSRNEWKYHAELVMNLDPDLPFISGFGGDLNQVFLNVLVNAAHAIETKIQGGEAKGTVTISTRATNGHVEICVADTGCGIAPENLHRVFDPFFTTKPVGKGTGQGLAISYQIVVAKHGGTIEFHSTPGEGTQCVITLPITAQGAAHA